MVVIFHAVYLPTPYSSPFFFLRSLLFFLFADSMSASSACRMRRMRTTSPPAARVARICARQLALEFRRSGCEAETPERGIWLRGCCTACRTPQAEPEPDCLLTYMYVRTKTPRIFTDAPIRPNRTIRKRRGAAGQKKLPLASKGPSGCARSPRRDQEPRSGPRSRRWGKNDCKSARRRALVIQQTRRGSFSAASKLIGDHRINLMTT